MEKLSRLTTEDRENLTAYLDGELDEESTRRIESVLASSAVARNDVELLARTYDLLDDLPRPGAPSNFTEKTVATAKLEGYRKPLSQQPWFQVARRGLILGTWTVAIIATGTTCYLLTNRWVPQQEDLLIEKYPVIRNLDVYSEVGSVEFLNKLTAEPDLIKDIRARAGRDSE